MIDVKLSGKKVTITRSYDFPKIGPVDAYSFFQPYTYEIPLAGLDPKSPSAKRILKNFVKTYTKAVSSKERSRNSENYDIWLKAANSIEKQGDLKKTQNDTQKTLSKRWKDFHDKVLEPALYDVVAELADEDLKANKIPRAKASSWKDYFAGITLGKGAVAVGTAAAATTIAAPLAVLVAVVAAMDAARKTSEKIYRDIDTVQRALDKGLDEASGALDKVSSQAETLEKHKQRLSATMIKRDAQIKQLTREFKAVSQIANKENIHAARLKVIKKQVATLENAMRTDQACRNKMVGDLKTIATITRQCKQAASDFTSERSTYDKLLASATSYSQAISILNDAVGSFKKENDAAKKKA